MKRLAPILLASLSFACSALAEENEGTKHYPNPAWLAWLHIDYPARFKMDPASHQGEAKWWAKFDDPVTGLAVSVDSYGYISDLDLLFTVPGVTHENYTDKLEGGGEPGAKAPSLEELIAAEAKCKSAGQYFREQVVPKGSEVAEGPGYERHVHTSDDTVSVYFLSKEAYRQTSSRCYQTLRFTFPKGTFPAHRKAIEAIIRSAQPAVGTDREEGVAAEPLPAPTFAAPQGK